MKKQSTLTALGGALLVGSTALSQEYNSQQQTPRQTLEQRIELTQKDIYFRGVINDLLISDVVQTHINMSAPNSSYFKEIENELEYRLNDKTKAREKLLESFSYPHRLCLALAMTYRDNEIPEQEYEDLGKKIAGLEHTISTLAEKSYVDYLDVRVYKQIKEWGKLKTEEFQKLYNASKTIPQGNLSEKENRIKYLKRVYQKAFTPEEYAKNVRLEDAISLRIEKALISTITRGPMHQATIKEEIRDINNSAKQIRYGIFYGYFEGRPTLPHQIR